MPHTERQAGSNLVSRLSNSDDICNSFEPADYLVCGELLEHILEPALLLENIGHSLKLGGIAFITGALVAAQSDHVFRFVGKTELDGMIIKKGFSILAEQPFIHPSRDYTDNQASVIAFVLAQILHLTSRLADQCT